MDEFLPRLRQIIVESRRHCYVTRNIQVQKEAIEKLKKIKKDALILKKQAITRQDEPDANMMLSIECMIEALISELQMHVHLKNGEPSEAWISLIDAQGWTNYSMRAFTMSEFSLDEYAQKLLYVEKILFPPQSFTSPSMAWEKTECSICKKDYGKCEHIAGEPYMGEFCIEIIHEIKEFFHLALVTHPADKRRVTISFSAGKDGLSRDYMTWNLYKDEHFSKLEKSDNNKTTNRSINTTGIKKR